MSLYLVLGVGSVFVYGTWFLCRKWERRRWRNAAEARLHEIATEAWG